tara:strand:+ start:15 stop:1166 length:1152 start_codon:yes stop_codon:yes gene_type:complete
MKKISILGSTGSIGINTLDVIEEHPDRFEVFALSAGKNVELLARQVRQFRPKIVSVFDSSKIDCLREALEGQPVQIVSGESGNIEIATLSEVDMVVSGIVGAAGLFPTYEAIRAGKTIALANKETLVVAGELMIEAARGKSEIIPVDSEHSAIFQVLNGESTEHIKKIILTASGGPFRTWSLEKMKTVTVREALNHPNWSMGSKITIDSATMMNKGLEYIEAKWLFGTDIPVEIVVHPQSVIHSMVEFVDTSIMAQLGMPDMRVPIAYALCYPDRLDANLPSLDLARLGQMTFETPDTEKFPCIKLAMEALTAGETMPAVLNAANEVAVGGFLEGHIPFKDIPEIIRSILERHKPKSVSMLEEVLHADRWARGEARKLVAVPI